VQREHELEGLDTDQLRLLWSGREDLDLEEDEEWLLRSIIRKRLGIDAL
jgi:hypothetical protein